jgi:carboxypeptidase PM20D1
MCTGVMETNTDTKWYLDFTQNVYRFTPTMQDDQSITRYHGDNERVTVDMYSKSVSFYYRLIRNADKVINYVPTNDVL